MSENERNYFFWNEKAFEDSVKKIVCPECPYAGFHKCKNPDPQGCAVYRYLPELVRVAQRLENPNLSDYSKAVEKEIAFHCGHAAVPGTACRLLDSPRCGLDQLLPRVLEAVLKTDTALETRQPGGSRDSFQG